MSEISNIIANNHIDLILYKGGSIERDLCEELRIASLNIECIPELEKIQNHDLRAEVNWYYGQIMTYIG